MEKKQEKYAAREINKDILRGWENSQEVISSTMAAVDDLASNQSILQIWFIGRKL